MLRLTIRNLLARKLRLVMSTLAIVLGIGFLTGVMTFSHGLGATFDNIVQGSTPDATVAVTSNQSSTMEPTSSTKTLRPADVDDLAALPQVANAEGSVDGYGAFLLDHDGRLYGGQGAPTLVYNTTSVPNMAGEPMMTLASGSMPTRPGQVVLDTTTTEQAGYHLGDDVSIILPSGETKKLRLIGTATLTGGGTAGATIVLLETGQAQVFFLGGADVFTSILLQAADGVSQQQLADAASSVIPSGFTATTGDDLVEQSQDQINQFLSVISIFLITFALIAIIVGGFIIFNTFTILISQRVHESALLRALGASRRQITQSVILEAVIMGLLGASVGLVVGLLLARALAAAFLAVGLDIATDVLTLTPSTAIWAYVVGLVVTMIAAWLPAHRAGKVAPVAALRDDLVVQEASLRWRTIGGTMAVLVGVALAVIGLIGGPGNDALWIGAAAVIWVITAAILAPVIGHPLLLGLRWLYGKIFGTPGRLAAENAIRSPRRTGATASALMIGLAVVSAVGVLAASLSATVDDLIAKEFPSDFVVQTPTYAGFPTTIGDQLAVVDGVADVARQQVVPASTPSLPSLNYVAAVTEDFVDTSGLEVHEGSGILTGDRALITADTAAALKLTVGDALDLHFPGNAHSRVRIGGTFTTATVDAQILVPMSAADTAGVQRSDNALTIRLAPDADADAVRQQMDQVLQPYPMVLLMDKEAMADAMKNQLNQLLYMIFGLLALAIIIAIFGIVNTLGLSVMERTREIGLLRAVGLARSRLRAMITLESVAIAALGAILGMAVGVIIGVLLRQSLRADVTVLAVPMRSLGLFLLVSIVIGVLAAVFPAIRASRMKVLDAIAQE
ncbi:MAG: ABC transporter permease [Nostocoides sp.]